MEDGVVGNEFAQHFIFCVSSHFLLQYHRSCRSLINSKCFDGITLRWELKNLKQFAFLFKKLLHNGKKKPKKSYLPASIFFNALFSPIMYKHNPIMLPCLSYACLLGKMEPINN